METNRQIIIRSDDYVVPERGEAYECDISIQGKIAEIIDEYYEPDISTGEPILFEVSVLGLGFEYKTFLTRKDFDYLMVEKIKLL